MPDSKFKRLNSFVSNERLEFMIETCIANPGEITARQYQAALNVQHMKRVSSEAFQALNQGFMTIAAEAKKAGHEFSIPAQERERERELRERELELLERQVEALERVARCWSS